jgi:hypothetical protein
MHKICAAVRHPFQPLFTPGFPSGQSRKCLIHIGFVDCLFSEQIKQGLDFQGPGRRESQLSTKLSTEALDMSADPLTSST